MVFPKISIVTPSFNDSAYLEETLQSVLEQGYPNLEYIVIDGGSQDGSVDIIRKFERQLTYWVSERDNGMYDALQKGFERSTGEIMGWINSDDRHHRGSLFTLAEIFSEHKAVNWIQGVPNIIDESGRVLTVSPRPEVNRFFFYSRQHLRSGKYIQQESTFWRRSLWQQAGGYISREYRYASDFDLWIRFFKYDKLYNVPALLGAFRMTAANQASLNFKAEYEKESETILRSLPLTREEMKQFRNYESSKRKARILKKISSWFQPQQDSSVENFRFVFDRTIQKLKMR